ncbi:glucose-6-phosphate isomerase [Chondrus crispus]|uniref:Glucose-6-phosphate isomerase n=1 Tax=Chondrus crispus TaxID=2769 RepID=R7Q5R1_CHOCR|nr:glucose-6-phosphate isomerase [Chondrus crispus]CDF33354.1 glucose-6-phosphate isomerase [Chondrus crispus]|eukprot:XP_005713157.1 glucose-6-phosphate isomerase [Chondrus crispus]
MVSVVETDVAAALDALKNAASAADDMHLRDLLMDEDRCAAMVASHTGFLLDYSRQRLTKDSMSLLFDLARRVGLSDKIAAMFNGDKINTTEGRSVLHVALRAPKTASITTDGTDVVPAVHEVLDKIKGFTDKVRSGAWVGATGKTLTDVVAIGIGGSYLGPEFVFEALRMDPKASAAASGRRLRFLANVDPVDVARAREGLNPETTLVLVISKTFTTAETMLNARTMRAWIVKALGSDAVAKHMVAVSTNLKGVEAFGINPENAFGFWDWVGGRYSVSSAVGVVPLALQYGFDVVSNFLAGAHDMDEHFKTAPAEQNLPVIMGLIGVWNSTFLGYSTRALLPYQQALLKLAPHIQQVDMESNGKRVRLDGSELNMEAGPINFGEPGTNGQHSFYQLIHQGRVVPCDFVAVIKSQVPVSLPGEPVSNHDELMSNFFAQPDALAFGKSAEQCRVEGIREELVPHKTFPGNRPSSSMLIDELNAFTVGQLLALFEHRTVVEGFIWGINSFDQWGVELGKVLAKDVRTQLTASRSDGADVSGFNPSTTMLLKKYLSG